VINVSFSGLKKKFLKLKSETPAMNEAKTDLEVQTNPKPGSLAELGAFRAEILLERRSLQR
jgi:hypothetical protein